MCIYRERCIICYVVPPKASRVSPRTRGSGRRCYAQSTY